MFRLTFTAVLAILSLSSCDKLVEVVKARNRGSLADEIKISSSSKQEIVTAFEAIAQATSEHNRVFLENHDSQKPANELACSAGIEHLGRSARQHGGLTKQVIHAVTATCIYEKGLFTPFDKISMQLKGMPTWSSDRSTQLRGQIQIIDQIIVTYDGAVSYLECGEQPLQQRNFDKYKVPAEVSAEFFRLSELYGKEVAESKLGMFREQRSALQLFRESMTSGSAAKANELAAQARQHEQKAKQFESRMIAAVRKQLKAQSLP